MNEITEDKIKLRQRSRSDKPLLVLSTKGSAGNNQVKLAQICSVWDFVIGIMGWEKKPLANLTLFLTQYQGSIDGTYHKDLKDVLIAEEIEKKRRNRRGGIQGQGLTIVSNDD